MSLLFVGLGNHMLASTRHNLGMMSLDYAVQKLGLVWQFDKQVGGWIAETDLSNLVENTQSNDKVYFFKPKEYMNLSGKPVKRLVNMKKIPKESIVLLHDDLEKKLGKVGIKEKGSANGHNGIKSVAERLNTLDIKRIRLGIDRPEDKDKVADYVLSKFTEKELEVLNSQVYPLVHDIILQLARKHASSA